MSRPRYQKGSVIQRNGQWVLRYYEDRLVDGKTVRVRASKNIAAVDKDCRTETQARALADAELSKASVNVGTTKNSDGSLTLAEFVDTRYFLHLDQRLQMTGEFHLEPSTLKGYRDIWKFRVKNTAIASVRVRDFTTAHAQQFFESLDQKLSHQSHLRVKAFLSGVFNRAKQINAINGVNPVEVTKVGGTKKDFEGHAYSLAEIEVMLKKLPEPARTVCAVAAFTGLSASELRGLRWRDYDETKKTISVVQKVWGKHIGQPKTDARSGDVPVIPALQKILRVYRKAFPPNGSDFMFRGEKIGFALNLDNLSRRTIAPVLNGGWHGWHSFRRGLGTRLFYAGADPKTVQTVLRHAQVAVTMEN
jgi:integrase